MTRKTAHAKELALLCAQAAINKKANHSLIYDVAKLGAFTDYFLITSGTNERQVQAIADEIFRVTKEVLKSPASVEGYEEGRWVLVDLGSVVVHIFHDYIREFYDLETLWGAAPRLEIPQEYYTSTTGSSSAAGI